jgi:hypothetical protein
VPQTAEQITAIEWTDAARRKNLLADCFPLIREMLMEIDDVVSR